MICAATKQCELCGRRPPLKGQRYCLTCRNRMIVKMAKSGYLQKIPREPRIYRDLDARETLSKMLPPSWGNVLTALDDVGEPMDHA